MNKQIISVIPKIFSLYNSDANSEIQAVTEQSSNQIGSRAFSPRFLELHLPPLNFF